DGLVADHRGTVLERQPAGDLARRPSHRKPVTDQGAQRWLARQLVAAPTPAPPLAQHLRSLPVIAARPCFGGAAVTPDLAADRARRAAEGRGNLALRPPACSQAGDRLPLSRAELVIEASHCNTTLGGIALGRDSAGSRGAT